jgi:glutathione S-transferase
VAAKLYSISFSHPSHAARAMLELKGVEHRVVNLLPGFHIAILRAAGFSGSTVPALKLDGRRIQGSIPIARELEGMVAEPPLYPSDPDLRRRVEEAERWGEGPLQDMPRRVGRWAGANHQHVRRWVAEEIGLPLPGVMAATNAPVVRMLARQSDATDENVRADLAALPDTLDRIDALIAEDTIGGEQPNAADFQIASSVRLLLAMDDIRPFVEGRPGAQLARRLFPTYPEPFPRAFPVDWLPAQR